MIREYAFYCESCSYKFTEYLDWNKISNYKPACPHCKKDEVHRDFAEERVFCDDGVPKTVGALADKHSKKRGINIK